MSVAPTSFNLLAPGMTPGWSFYDRTGAILRADSTGMLTGLTSQQMYDARRAGCSMFMANQSPPVTTYTEDSTATAHTLSVASFTESTDQVLALTGAMVTGLALTLMSAAALAAVIPGAVAQGAKFKLRIINRSSNSNSIWTLTADSGATFTLTGTMTIAHSAWRDFLVTIAAGGLTGTIQAIGTGTAG